MAWVLLVDDCELLLRAVARGLHHRGHEVRGCTSGEQALRLAGTSFFDVLVVDSTISGLACRTLIRELRSRGNTTPIILMAEGNSALLRARDAGADDFIEKPFLNCDLHARICALVLRPAASTTSGFRPAYRATRAKAVEFIRAQRILVVHGDPVELTAQETRLLQVVVEAEGRVVAWKDLQLAVWGIASTERLSSVDPTISRLRVKFGSEHWRLNTVRGSGLRFLGSAKESTAVPDEYLAG